MAWMLAENAVLILIAISPGQRTWFGLKSDKTFSTSLVTKTFMYSLVDGEEELESENTVTRKKQSCICDGTEIKINIEEFLPHL